MKFGSISCSTGTIIKISLNGDVTFGGFTSLQNSLDPSLNPQAHEQRPPRVTLKLDSTRMLGA